MRRQLSGQLPLLMRIYPGLKPWELDRLTFGEVESLLTHARDVLAQEAARE